MLALVMRRELQRCPDVQPPTDAKAREARHEALLPRT